MSVRRKWKWEEAWAQWVPDGWERVADGRPDVEPLAPLGMGPLHPDNTHSSGCLCPSCMTAGQRYADHLKAKALEWG